MRNTTDRLRLTRRRNPAQTDGTGSTSHGHGRKGDVNRWQYPVKITQTNPKIAQVIITQFGGPDGELAASMRYLSQRYTMPYKEVTGILTDIGTEELAHMEMICAIVHQLTRNLSVEEVEKYGFDKYYVDHTLALWPQAASGAPWTATYFQSKGDPITDLHEDMAADGTTAYVQHRSVK